MYAMPQSLLTVKCHLPNILAWFLGLYDEIRILKFDFFNVM